MKRPFDEVVREHGSRVLRVCRAVLGTADADDAWSETFLAALRAYPDLPEDANLEAWLVTIARRKALDLVRADRRRAARLAASAALPDPPAAEPAPEDGELWSHLAALPDKQRRTVAYHHVGGFSYAEIAELLGGTPEAARRAASDGIRMLRARHRATDERTTP